MEIWINTPTETDLLNKGEWLKKGKDSFAASRHHILVVEKKVNKIRKGRIFEQMELPVGTKLSKNDKITQSSKYNVGIEESITSAVTAKLSTEILNKVGGSFSAGLKGVSAKIGNELQTKIGSELTESVTNSLKLSRNYEFQQIEEQSKNVEVTIEEKKGDKAERTLIISLQLREYNWDVYLYRTDFIKLKYKKHWLWDDIRNTINAGYITLKEPLFRIVFYEPISLSYTYDTHTPEVLDENTVEIQELTEPCPNHPPTINKSLREIAKIVFPVSRSEKKVAKEVLRTTTVGRFTGGKAASKKAAAKRAAAKRAAPKKAAAKKAAPKKAAPKKSA